jgi:sugar/nucleoside kinase (ribokinase family)
VTDSPSFDILGIGNAIVDIVSPADDAFLSKHDMRKGAMMLIDRERAEYLSERIPPGRMSSGGSAANTCAVAASLGARVAFSGKVAEDTLGATFRQDIADAGVYFPTPPLVNGAPTARCIILVTPEGQRTMNTYLGACVTFSVEDLDPTLIADSAVTYLEGYLFDPPAAQTAFHHAAQIARAAGRRIALSLSDPFCVSRHRAAFRELVRRVDILFANEAEVCSLYECNTLEEAAEFAAAEVPLAALTQSEAGSLICRGRERVRVAAEPTEVVDTTGAGDAYAAGFLVGLSQGLSLYQCGRLGSLVAAEVISHYGARPLRDLSGYRELVVESPEELA